MRATVLLATYRPLGAVVPLRALKAQVHRDFDIVLVTEIGSLAWDGDAGKAQGLLENVKVVEAPFTPYHSPTHSLNLALEAAPPATEAVALLADCAWPDPCWLGILLGVLGRGVAAVGGGKCSHLAEDPWLCGLTASLRNPCLGHPLLPLGLDRVPADGAAVVHPFQRAFNLGNLAFRLSDGLAVNGFEERFAGGHGYEDENFVRRLVAFRRAPAVLARSAVIHHYWPYGKGYKPLLKLEARPWAAGLSNQALDRLLTDAEVLVGMTRAQRVDRIDAPEAALEHRSLPDYGPQ